MKAASPSSPTYEQGLEIVLGYVKLLPVYKMAIDCITLIKYRG
jgi:hypothetical protein